MEKGAAPSIVGKNLERGYPSSKQPLIKRRPFRRTVLFFFRGEPHDLFRERQMNDFGGLYFFHYFSGACDKNLLKSAKIILEIAKRM